MNIVLIVAAGEGKRFKNKLPKLMLPVNGKPLLYYTIATFYDHPDIDKILVVVNRKIKKHVEKIIKVYFSSKQKEIRLTFGGMSRSESVLNGLQYLNRYLRPKQKDIVLVHNGANPLVTFDEIKKCIEKAKIKGACIVASSVKDTLKETIKAKILKTHNRDKFIHAQTPQAFQYGLLQKALKKAGNDYMDMTDEASLVEKAGFHVFHIPASEHNFKITTFKDYEHLKHIMGDLPEDYLVGIGQDSHSFSTENGLILGGLRFNDEKKLKANSDGDVLIHALCNALLQAIGEKSLGAFADNWCLKKKIKDSRKYLEKIMRKVKRKGYEINNVGCMLECKRPKIDAISTRLKTNLSYLCKVSVQRVGITATSGEKLTSFGKGKGIQCFCIVSLKKV